MIGDLDSKILATVLWLKKSDERKILSEMDFQISDKRDSFIFCDVEFTQCWRRKVFKILVEFMLSLLWTTKGQWEYL